MKAAIRRRYGPPGDVVELADVERPTPGDDEVLVKVRAASVNRADLDGIQPRPRFVRLFIGVRAPRDPRLGLDVAGVVEAVGSGVTRFKPGTRAPPSERSSRSRPGCPSRRRRRCRIRRSSRSRVSGAATVGPCGPVTAS